MKLSLTKQNQSEGDYSGLDITRKEFRSIDLHNSVFNGAYFVQTKFIDCDLRHTEFTEAKFEECIFDGCNLDYCDFVFLQAQQTKFINCSFTHAEWRENSFTELDFVKCKFYNSTISLCTFSKAIFDHDSAYDFYGATKRYNVFSESVFELFEDKIDFLTVNFGIQRAKNDATFRLSPKHRKDLLLVLSVQCYFNNLNTQEFVRLITGIGNELSGERQKNHIQKIKYLILICRQMVRKDSISVFGIQLLINSLNAATKKITDSILFMEMVDLIMLLKTHQYKLMRRIETEVNDYIPEYTEQATFNCKLENSYNKADVRKFTYQLADFLVIPRNQVKIVAFQKGSTFFEFIIKGSVSIGGFLLFINFSLHQVHKTIDYLAKIKKNIKYLRKKSDEKKETSKETGKNNLAVVPFAVMNNEGNIYYSQVTNIINIHGTELVKIDGTGKMNISTKKAKAS